MIDKDLINEEYSFTTTDESGKEVICDTLALIEKEDNPIIIYTDYTLDENGKFNMFVSQLIKKDDGFYLEAINDYSEMPEVREALDKIW